MINNTALPPTDPLPTPLPPPPPAPPLAPATLPPKTWSKSLIIMLTVLPILIVLGIGGWWRASAAKDAYTKETATYQQAVTNAFRYYQNSTDVSNHVKDIEDKLGAPLANQPQKPKLLFISLSPPSASKKQADQLTASLTSVRDSFKNLHDLDAQAADPATAATQQFKDMYSTRYDTLAKNYDALAILLGL